eukprot:scaffold295831_cov36-Tisochrysis_lutea.AAC.2
MRAIERRRLRSLNQLIQTTEPPPAQLLSSGVQTVPQQLSPPLAPVPARKSYPVVTTISRGMQTIPPPVSYSIGSQTRGVVVNHASTQISSTSALAPIQLASGYGMIPVMHDARAVDSENDTVDRRSLATANMGLRNSDNAAARASEGMYNSISPQHHLELSNLAPTPHLARTSLPPQPEVITGLPPQLDVRTSVSSQREVRSGLPPQRGVRVSLPPSQEAKPSLPLPQHSSQSSSSPQAPQRQGSSQLYKERMDQKRPFTLDSPVGRSPMPVREAASCVPPQGGPRRESSIAFSRPTTTSTIRALSLDEQFEDDMDSRRGSMPRVTR